MEILTKVFGYSKDELLAIKDYCENINVETSEIGFLYEAQDIFMTNLFVDNTCRFEYTGEKMIEEYGEENLKKFFKEVMKKLNS